MNHWDSFFLSVAEKISTQSKDPSTKVGAVIVRPDRTIASVGYNGFPRGVDDSEELYLDRRTKYAMIVHAEANAIIHAREPLEGTTIYLYPFPPCSNCAGLVIQAGIKRVVAPQPTVEDLERWGESMQFAVDMFEEAGVQLELV